MSKARRLSSTNPGRGVPDLDLRLAVLETVRPATQRLSVRVIADIIGCSRGTVFNIEKSALRKMRISALRLEL